jgi:hypothetical protein
MEVEFTASFAEQFDRDVSGRYTCAGLTVRFHAWRVTEADAALHRVVLI